MSTTLYALGTQGRHSLGSWEKATSPPIDKDPRSLNLMGYMDLHTWAMHNRNLPLSISTVYFSTVVPGLLSRDLTFTPQLSYKLHTTKNYRVPVKPFTIGPK